MSERLEGLVKKARSNTKTFGGIVEGGTTEEFEFGNASGDNLFRSDSDLEDYSYENAKAKGWNGKYPEGNENFYSKLENIIDKNKQQ